MICELVLSFAAYNVDLKKVEGVKIYRCEKKYSETVKTLPKNRVCGFTEIDGEKYWYCFVKERK